MSVKLRLSVSYSLYLFLFHIIYPKPLVLKFIQSLRSGNPKDVANFAVDLQCWYTE